MKKELISDFTRRISQCNKGGLIVIMYDIVFAYLDEAKQSYEKKDHEAFKEAVRNADRSILELIHSLDFSYEIAKELYPLYVYCREELSKTL